VEQLPFLLPHPTRENRSLPAMPNSGSAVHAGAKQAELGPNLIGTLPKAGLVVSISSPTLATGSGLFYRRLRLNPCPTFSSRQEALFIDYQELALKLMTVLHRRVDCGRVGRQILGYFSSPR
jgi:hypothetical protein